MTSTSASPSHFDPEAVVASCRNLSKHKLRRFADRETVAPVDAFFLWLEDTLAGLGWEKEQLEFVLDELRPNLQSVFIKLWGSLLDVSDRTIQVPVIVVADRRFVTMSGADGFIDIDECKWVKGMRTAFLETINYNLNTLVMRRYLPLKHRKIKDEQPDPSKTARG